MNRHTRLILCITTLLLAASSTAAWQGGSLRDDFVACAGVPAVTGREEALIGFIRERLPAGTKSEIDNMGNLIVRYGTAEPELLLVASVDEPGFVVTEITEDGYLRIAPPGGRTPSPLFLQFYEGHYVDIAAGKGTIRGVMSLPSSHLVRGRREPLTPDRALIDIGARSRQEARARGVESLDPLTAVKDIAVLAGNRIAGPMLSRKFGALALLEALKEYRPAPEKNVVLAWTTQSALSNSGVTRLSRRFTPKRVLVVGAFQRGGGRGAPAGNPVDVLGSGVLVPEPQSRGGTGRFQESAMASAGGKVKTIPSPAGTLPELRAFGQAADAFAVAIPVAFPGSLVETIDLDDLQQLVDFIRIVLAS